MSQISVSAVDRKIVTIVISPFEGGTDAFWKKVREEFSFNEHVLPILEANNVSCGIEETSTVRIAFPPELGCAGNMPAWEANSLAERNGLNLCSESIPIRIAMDFETIRPTLPPEYLKTNWWIHMARFKGGLGNDAGVFVIQPHYSGPRVLTVEEISNHRRFDADRDQPLLFQCK